MEVKEIIKLTAIYLQMEDILALEELGGEVTEPEELTSKNLELLIRCLNLVYNEVASDYVPLKHTQTVTSENGEISLESLEKRLISVLSLIDSTSEVSVKYKVYPTSIKVKDGSYNLEYSYMPDSVVLENDIEGFGGKLSERIMAYGVASEYLLISGLFDEATLWKKRFLDSILTVSSKKSDIKMPARRWF
ncbi:MAG: hypothetical protein PHC46_02365 [Clostridia bacterium]|nr:hypothetical protein [Clostridia bacterium]